MIYKQCIMTIAKNGATLDEDIYLYRLDKNIELHFMIVNNRYKFDKSDLNNIIAQTDAAYFQVRLYKNADIKYTFAIQPTDGGKAILKITDDLIDDPIEVGDYDFQISLLDTDRTSMISMPIVTKQLHVCEPLVGNDAVMGKAVMGLSKLVNGEIKNAFDSEGNYIREIHNNGDIISAQVFNKFEEALEANTKAITDKANDSTVIQTDITALKTAVGTAELTTTAKDLKSAVNEISTQYKAIEDNKAEKSTTNDLQTQINNIVLGASETDENIKAEVQQARGNNSLLSERLNTIEDTIGHLSNGDDIKTYINFNWEIGGFNGATGEATSADNRIKTTTYFHSNKELFYDLAEGYTMYIYQFSYDSSSNTYTFILNEVVSLSGKGTYSLDDNVWYKFGIKKIGVVFDGSEYKYLKLWTEEKCAIAKKTDLYSPNITNYNIPSYWESTIKNKEMQIKDIVINATKNNEIINMFFTSTDNHYPINTCVSTDLMAYLSEKCGISMSVCMGDLITDSTLGHEDGLNRLHGAMKQLQRMSNVLLITQGNHDNNCGIPDSNSKLNCERIIYDNEWILHTSNKLDTNNINFYSNGKAFYYDDKLQKIRFISIDAFENKSYTINGGNVDSFDLGEPSNEQINWIKDEALTNIPNNYAVVSFAHLSLFPIYANNGVSDVNLNLGGVGNSEAITQVFKDFKTSGGDYIGHFSGHVHHDFMNNQAGFYCVQTLNDGTHWRQASYFAGNEFVGDAPKKITGTTTECAFDVVIVNRTTHKVNLIRIGAGEDREFIY